VIMGEFFRGWRRKIGVMTLVMAKLKHRRPNQSANPHFNQVPHN